jgi:YHS domain-containing protein
MAKDPVCGKEIDDTSLKAEAGRGLSGVSEVDPQKGTRSFYNGKWYTFCSLDCRSKFMATPAKYLK